MNFTDFQPQAGRHGYVIVNSSMVEDMNLPITMDPLQYAIIRHCTFCGKAATTIVPAQGLWDWEHGMFAQNAFPDLTAGEREQLITGTHSECWDRYMKEDES